MFEFFVRKQYWHWSILGTLLIFSAVWYSVQLDVQINEWFGEFYDLLQKALAEPGAVTLQEYYAQLFTFFQIAAIYIACLLYTSPSPRDRG